MLTCSSEAARHAGCEGANLPKALTQRVSTGLSARAMKSMESCFVFKSCLTFFVLSYLRTRPLASANPSECIHKCRLHDKLIISFVGNNTTKLHLQMYKVLWSKTDSGTSPMNSSRPNNSQLHSPALFCPNQVAANSGAPVC